MAFWKSNNDTTNDDKMQQEQRDFTSEELHTIIGNGIAIINGTHETAGPEWSPVAIAVIRGALQELNEKKSCRANKEERAPS